MKEVTIKTIGWTTFGVVFVIMFYSMFISLSISNLDIKTEHTININSDNETKQALRYLADIKKYQVKENNLDCENRLLNQSKYYENQLFGLERYYLTLNN
jgi:hypothetical protein